MKDIHLFVKVCDLCQQIGQMPHQMVLPFEPFHKYELNFMTFRSLVAQTRNQYILVAINY